MFRLLSYAWIAIGLLFLGACGSTAFADDDTSCCSSRNSCGSCCTSEGLFDFLDGDSCCGSSCGGGTCFTRDCCPSLYGSIILGGSIMDGRSGGVNTLVIPSFFNTGNGSDVLFNAGGTIGIAIPKSSGTFRFEAEGQARNIFNSVTNSYRPPAPTYFYQVTLEDSWTLMGNAWYDYSLNNRWSVYGGGGLGMAGFNLSVNDTVAEGRGASTNFAFQLGAGLSYRLREKLTVDFGYRYVDMGLGNIRLNPIGSPGFDGGNYSLDVTSHEFVVAFRFNRLGDLLGR